ncbi:MAG: nitroreductase family protein [Salinivirgaceae bacterium]
MIHPLLEKRYSPRAFSERPVSREQLHQLFEAARWSPSARNEQPWRFVFAVKENKEAYLQMLHVLNDWNQKWAQSAPVLIAAVAKKNYNYKETTNEHAWYDLGQSVAHLTFQATALGLYVHQMGGFSKEKASQWLGIPEGYEPVTMIAVGYKGDLERIPENYRADETKIRERLKPECIQFENHWHACENNE